MARQSLSLVLHKDCERRLTRLAPLSQEGQRRDESTRKARTIASSLSQTEPNRYSGFMEIGAWRGCASNTPHRNRSAIARAEDV